MKSRYGLGQYMHLQVHKLMAHSILSLPN